MEFTSDSSLQLEPETVVQNMGPVYNHRQFAPQGEGPQCSSSDQFCFLCSFAGCNGEEGESDDVTQLNDLICSLASEKKELPWIVNSVFSIYDKHIRPEISYTHPRTGMEVVSPYWSKESIHRHLLHSNSYPILFDSMCNSIFQNTIILQQDFLVNQDTGQVDESARQGLMCTLKNYTTWRLAQQKLHAVEVPKVGKSFK